MAKAFKLPKKNNIHASLISFILIIASVVIAIVPEFSLWLPKQYWLGTILLWYVYVAIFERNHELRKSLTTAYLLIIWFCYESFLKIVGYSTAETGNYFIKLACFDLLIKCVYIKQLFSNIQKQILFRTVQIIVIVCTIQNIIIGTITPNIHNLVHMQPDNFIGMNVAMTAYYNFLSFFIGISVLLIFIEKKTWAKIFDATVVVLAYYFMLNFEPRFTALSISLSLIFVAFVTHQKKRYTRIRLLCISFVGVLLAYYLFSSVIIDYLPERIAERFEALTGQNSDTEEYLERSRLMSLNISSFLNNPITGIGWHLGDTGLAIKVGQHSLITDYMACYGLIGIGFLFYYFKLIKNILRVGLSSNNVQLYGKYLFVALLIASVLSNTMVPWTTVSALLLFCVI
jgi:hypothetical protein